jgi:DNA-binding protein HU-beta
MNKPEWIKAVAAQLEQPEDMIAPILEAGLEEIYQSMKRAEKVTLINFGTFYIDVRRSDTVFKFNPSQKWKALFGWSSTFKGEL